MTISFTFHPLTDGFDLVNALALAQMSQLVYLPLADAGQIITNELKFETYTPFDCNDTQAFLASTPEFLILAFRGTTTMKDWCTDLKCGARRLPNGRVHSGFHNALDCIWNELYEKLATKAPEQSLWVTGHSLGGALAALAVDRLTELLMPVAGLYTFGQPKVGDGRLIKRFNVKMKGRAFRVINDEDVVPLVPPGYQHIGRPCFLDHAGQLHLENTFWQWWLSVSQSASMRTVMGAAKTAVSNPNGIGDHSIDDYVRKLMQNLPTSQVMAADVTFREFINQPGSSAGPGRVA